MQIFKTRVFARFARKERIKDNVLCEAIFRAERGLIDANLGEGLIKQRIPRPGEGRSGGYRAFIAYQPQERAVFLIGFAKSDRSNIAEDELRDLKRVVPFMLGCDDRQIASMIENNAWKEVKCDD